MKKRKLAQQFLKEYSEVPIVSFACQKTGISRNTVYRWCSEDPDFKLEMEKAERLGNESITDLAQSKLLTHVQRGEPWAIQFLLRNRHKNYAYPRPAGFWDELMNKRRINGFEVIIRQGKTSPTSSLDKKNEDLDSS